MTVAALIAKLQEIAAAGHAETEVVMWEHQWGERSEEPVQTLEIRTSDRWYPKSDHPEKVVYVLPTE